MDITTQTRPEKILIADDDEFVVRGMRLMLESAHIENWVVDIEYNYMEEVYLKLLADDYTVLILDLDWYGNKTTSVDSIKMLSATNPSLRIIAITAFPELVNHAKKAGASVARQKGFTGEELKQLVQTALKIPNKSPQVTSEKSLLDIHQRRLKILLEIKDYKGANTPPEIRMEIEDIQAAINKITGQPD